MALCHIGTAHGKKFLYDINWLTRHAAVLGTTGSGKTVMAKVLMEEALIRGIPIIAIDPKGDLATLAVANRNLDFRPFTGTGQKRAQEIAGLYRTRLHSQGVDLSLAIKLANTATTVYTPKSTAGKPLSLIPDLSAPARFRELVSETGSLVADFVEPVSESVVHLAGIKGAIKEKAQSLISSILVHEWTQQRDATIEGLIPLVINPPFPTIGSLPVEEYLKEKERKSIAASLNLILSSPAKNAWKQGERINIKEQLEQHRLSVYDLRFVPSQEERQFVVEQVLQAIYKHIMRSGSSEKLRYLLYIDELAGLLPPPPASPPSKKLLELLIRQARAFGLGIIVATQSPGDIDYKIFSNMGTRFIGRLRTELEMEKMATAMDLMPGELKKKVSHLSPGQFVLNNAVKNSTTVISGRWLLSYHGGPLKPEEIKWINEPGTRPIIQGNIKPIIMKGEGGKAPSRIEGRVLVNSAAEPDKSRTRAMQDNDYYLAERYAQVQHILKRIGRHADTVSIKAALTEKKDFAPHLKITVEPRPIKGMQPEAAGPYLFDLTTKTIPLDNYLKHVTWSTFIPSGMHIAPVQASIVQAFDYSIPEALKELCKDYYQSTLAKAVSESPEDITAKNMEHLMVEAGKRIQMIERRESQKSREIAGNIRARIFDLNILAFGIQKDEIARFLGRLFSPQKKKRGDSGLIQRKQRVQAIKRQIRKLSMQEKRIHEKSRDAKEILLQRTEARASRSVRKIEFRPRRQDVTVHATLLLVPAAQEPKRAQRTKAHRKS